MSNLLKVTLEFDDKILTVEGKDAEEWQERVLFMETLAWAHSCFKEKVNWKETKK